MAEVSPGVSNDTRIHVAQLLQEQVGAVRQSRVAVDELPLDDELTARDVQASVRLTRIPAGVLASGTVQGTVEFECIRCLDEFDRSISAEFADVYRPTIDIGTGAEIPETDAEDEDEFFQISDIHLLDLQDSLRQAIVLELPMAPLCREDCPGLPEVAELSSDGDARLAVLGRLLADEAEDEREQDHPGTKRRRRA